MKNKFFLTALIFLIVNLFSSYAMKRDEIIVAGHTFNSSIFFDEPLIWSNDGYLYIIKSDESMIIKKYLKNKSGKSSWRKSSNNKKIKFSLARIEKEEEKLPKYVYGDFSTWTISKGTGYPAINTYPPIKGTYRVVKVIEPPH